MIIHYVKNGEHVSDILKNFNIEFEELKKYNQHITNFNQLPVGTKIKIPAITKEIYEEMNTVEPLIEDFYDLGDNKDKKDLTTEKENDDESDENISKKEDIKEEIKTKDEKKPDVVEPKVKKEQDKQLSDDKNPPQKRIVYQKVIINGVVKEIPLGEIRTI